MHKAEELGYHPQVILAGRAIRFFHKKSSKNCPSGVTVFGQPAANDISCTSGIPPPSLAKMDGVAVAHDEFRRRGLSGCGGGGG